MTDDRPRVALRRPTRGRMDTILARLVALLGLIFTAQTVPSMIAAADAVSPAWAIVAPLLWGVAVLVAAVCAVVRRGVRASAGAVSVVFLLLVVLWPVGAPEASSTIGVQPWIWYVFVIALAEAGIAVRPLLATGYTAIVTIAYVVLRLSTPGGMASPMPIAIETAYSVLTGVIIIVVLATLRSATTRVDEAQARAIERYTVAARQHAAELERTRVDAVVHDRVLASLLAAARASGPEQLEVAATMAARALDELAELSGAPLAEPDADEPGPDLDRRMRRIAASGRADSPVDYDAPDVAALPAVPRDVAEALSAAAAQAVENSIRHADRRGAPVASRPVLRSLALRPHGDGGVEVVVEDTGSGFDVAAVPVDRLGLRVSMVERMESVGGRVAIESAPGRGTRVVLRWLPVAEDSGSDVGDRGGA